MWNGPNNSTWLYVMGEGDHLKAFPFANGTFNLQAMKQSAWVEPVLNQVPARQSQANHGMWMPGGFLAASRLRAQPSSGPSCPQMAIATVAGA